MSETFKIRNKETGEIITVRRKVPSKKESVSGIDPFLPNKERVEELITKRDNPIDALRQEFSIPLSGRSLEQTAQIGARGIQTIGAGLQLAEGGVANVGLALQEGTFNPKTLLHEFIGGVTGEKPGELGDLIRTTGFAGPANEALANIVGFSGLVGSSNLAMKGKIVQGARKVSSAIKARSAAKAADKRFFFKKRADMLSEGADDVVSSVRGEFDELYKKIGNNPIGPDDVDVVRGAKDLVSPAELKRFARELKIDPKEVLDNVDDLNKVKSLKGIIGRAVPKKVWSGIDDAQPKHTELINKYHELNDILAKNAGSEKGTLLKLNSKFKEVLDFRKVINKITKEANTGTTKTTIRNIRSDSQQGNLAQLEDFSNKFFPKTKEILKDIDNFNKIQMVKKHAGTLAKIGVGYELLRRVGRAPVDSLLPE